METDITRSIIRLSGPRKLPIIVNLKVFVDAVRFVLSYCSATFISTIFKRIFGEQWIFIPSRQFTHKKMNKIRLKSSHQLQFIAHKRERIIYLINRKNIWSFLSCVLREIVASIIYLFSHFSVSSRCNPSIKQSFMSNVCLKMLPARIPGHSMVWISSFKHFADTAPSPSFLFSNTHCNRPSAFGIEPSSMIL